MNRRALLSLAAIGISGCISKPELNIGAQNGSANGLDFDWLPAVETDDVAKMNHFDAQHVREYELESYDRRALARERDAVGWLDYLVNQGLFREAGKFPADEISNVTKVEINGDHGLGSVVAGSFDADAMYSEAVSVWEGELTEREFHGATLTDREKGGSIGVLNGSFLFGDTHVVESIVDSKQGDKSQRYLSTESLPVVMMSGLDQYKICQIRQHRVRRDEDVFRLKAIAGSKMTEPNHAVETYRLQYFDFEVFEEAVDSVQENYKENHPDDPRKYQKVDATVHEDELVLVVDSEIEINSPENSE